MAHRIGVSDYCTAITGGPIVVIVAPMTIAKSMSSTTVLVESVTESMQVQQNYAKKLHYAKK